MLAANALLLNTSYKWSETDSETAIQAAAQVGSAPVAEFLLEQGAPLDICTPAMLGRVAEVERQLDVDPRNANSVGAHMIPLLPHAVWSGKLDLVRMVHQRGATSGANLALHNGVERSDYAIVQWLVENAGPDVSAKNFRGKTPVAVAKDRTDEKMVELLKRHSVSD